MDELIRLAAAATRVACPRITPLYRKVLHDSVEQARRMPSRFAPGRKAAAHAEIFDLPADVAGDPVLAVPPTALQRRRCNGRFRRSSDPTPRCTRSSA
jgi:hypothetical protein